MLVILCLNIKLICHQSQRNYFQVNQLVTTIRFCFLHLIKACYCLIFHKYNISTSNQLLLNSIIQSVSKFILVITHKYTPTCLHIKLRPFIFIQRLTNDHKKHLCLSKLYLAHQTAKEHKVRDLTHEPLYPKPHPKISRQSYLWKRTCHSLNQCLVHPFS